MYNDDELIGVEDVSVFELELILKRRLAYHSQSDRKPAPITESSLKYMQNQELETGIILDSPVIIESHIGSAADLEVPPDPSSLLLRETDEPDAGSDTDPDNSLMPDEEPFSSEFSATDSSSTVKPACRYSILSEKLMDERRYDDLMKSVNDLQYREQLYEEYAIGPTDTT